MARIAQIVRLGIAGHVGVVVLTSGLDQVGGAVMRHVFAELLELRHVDDGLIDGLALFLDDPVLVHREVRIAGQKAVDVRRAADAGFGDDRQVRRQGAAVCRAGRSVVREGRAETVRRRGRAQFELTGVVGDRADDLVLCGQRLHERVVVRVRKGRIVERAALFTEIAIAEQLHRMAAGTDLLVDLIAALDGGHVVLARDAFERPAAFGSLGLFRAAGGMGEACEGEAGQTGCEDAEGFHRLCPHACHSAGTAVAVLAL